MGREFPRLTFSTRSSFYRDPECIRANTVGLIARFARNSGTILRKSEIVSAVNVWVVMFRVMFKAGFSECNFVEQSIGWFIECFRIISPIMEM